MEQIFNELSADGSYDSHKSADEGMRQLISLVNKMAAAGFSRILRTTDNFCSCELCREYTISMWLHEHMKEESVRLFMSYATKSPYIKDLLDDDKNKLLEFRYKSKKVYGLGLACLWDTAALSLNCFHDSMPELECTRFEDGDIFTYYDSVMNLVSITEAERYKDKLRNILFRDVSDGECLVNRFHELFPRLILSREADKNIRALNGHESFFREYIKHFTVLNAAAEKWSEGINFEPALKWSYDTKETLSQYGDERTFVCGDGITRKFSAHTKLMSSNQRIYFLNDKGIVHIGYAGRHLPTVKYK